ncbi:TonB-dependent receptor [Flagellimonas zhangzhouensis]|uniref:TonB-dependent receptor n=1 Tax=Flagellimonas zhangzhouensis TaxID=1073328 RepID=A0A1H2VCB8_9FLAO|nr:TonB-dependent receptor [Allomuricauda zhangzhouensis]SDQ08975.1 TonB-dependent receptor [Allomuricauda zhangzhouensis]SDW65956.1 TonB-dependent receptor [Allomuricauda zhangzhouensis]
MNLTKLFYVTLFLVFGALSAQAQTGNIQGTITDENGIYVPGANVYIQSISKGAISNFDGKFTLVGIPEGSYTLSITYMGYSDVEQEVAVTAGQTTAVSISLNPSNVELDEVQVSAYGLSGQSKALNTQKTNMNITNVVSTDQIGKFPDANIGDAVKRIPGITMQVDQGEARNIIVRGLSPQLNSVTLNGSRIPSAESDNRNIQMDLIPSDMIQTIEVNKAVTPDMDGDALGGSVNLITRTAPQGFRLSATLGSGVNFITDKGIWNGSILVGDRTNDGKFGYMLSATINDNDFGSDNIEAEWTDEFEYNTGAEDDEGEPILEEADVDPYTNVTEQRTYLVQRVRRSFAANFDYQINANNNIYLKTMYNWRDDRENRFRLEQEILDGEDIEVGDFTINNGVLTRFPVEVKRQSKGGIAGGRNNNRRLEDQRMQNYTLGGDHLFGSLKVDWMASYAKASEERLNERYAEYESEYIVNNDNSNPKYPIMTAANADDFNDLGNFEFGEITNENQYTEEEDINFFANFELPADLFGKGGTIKFGGRGRFKTKLRDNDFYEYDLEDMYPTLADVPVKSYTDPDYLPGSKYVAGNFASEEWLGSLDLNNANGEAILDEFLPGNFEVKENVLAAYAMFNQKLTDKLSVLAGLRVENTKLESEGNRVTYIEEDEDAGIEEGIEVEQVSDENSYTNFLPGVHFKYDLNNNTILRFAWTNTLARPNYADLIPRAEIVNEDSEVVLGNPDLDPTTSMNFDVNAEHYFESVGIISGGLFYKRINDFIYTFITEAEDDSYAPGTAGYDVFQPLNGDSASIFGAEVSFQRQLDFLPGFAKNFSIYLNYTYLTSSADGIRNEDGDERTDLDLPNTAPNMFNGSLGYADKRFSARLSANFSDSYIDEIGGNPFEDRYYDTQFFLDFNATYAITNNLRIYTDVNNITNQPLRYFQGVKSRTQQMEFYDIRFTFGLKYDLFKK